MVQEMQPANHAGQERRDEVMVGARVFNRPRYQILDAPDLHFYVQERSAGVAVQDFFQHGRRLGGRLHNLVELLQRMAANDQAVEFGIMAENQMPVASAADVEFEALRAVVKSQVKGGDGVFRSPGSSAAMSEQQGFGGCGQTRQSRSKSRIMGPSSGLSLAFLTASWNFFSSRSALFFSAATACWKSDSLRPS